MDMGGAYDIHKGKNTNIRTTTGVCAQLRREVTIIRKLLRVCVNAHSEKVGCCLPRAVTVVIYRYGSWGVTGQ